jgi:gliding motility-associated-like protein
VLSTSVLSVSIPDPLHQFFYQVRSRNVADVSREYLIRSAESRSLFLVAPDQSSYFEFPSDSADDLFSSRGTSFRVEVSSRPEEIGGRVLNSIRFETVLDGRVSSSLKASGELPQMATLRLYYNPSVARTTGATARTAEAAGGQVSLFWNNGVKWVQLYGKADASEGFVSAQTRRLGSYQVRAVERTGAFSFNAAGLSNRFITPNGDGKNDNAVFTFDNPRESQVTGKIFDLKGSLVATMTQGPAQWSLMWDGMASGQAVPGGVYIFQIEAEGQAFNGTIVVIK